MNGLFSKTLFKKLFILVLLTCFMSESVFSSGITLVQAANTDSVSQDLPDNSAFYDNANVTKTEADASDIVDNLKDAAIEGGSGPDTNNTDDSSNIDDSSTDISNASTSTDDTTITNTSASSDPSTSSDTSTSTNASTSTDDSTSIDDTSTSIDTTTSTTNDIQNADTTTGTNSDIAGVDISKENFPDKVFMTYIAKHFDIDKNEILSIDEISKVENIDISNMGIGDLTGIEFFTSLVYLYCSGNKLHTLNLDTLVNLTVLNCSYNYLTSLDLSKCSSLISLECENNALPITLDENSFDLSALSGFDMEKAANWSKNITVNDSLLTITDDSDSSYIAYRYLVNAPLITDTYIEFSLVISSDTLTEIQIDETTFPDPAFREYMLKTFDMDKDSLLSIDEQKAVTYIFVPSQNIESLTGIEYFTNLVFLNFEGNNISSIDLNSLTTLRRVYCNDNQLTQLQIHELIHLEELYCSNNQLTYLDVNQLTKLLKLYCDGNLLTTLDTSNLTSLKELNCSKNKLYCLDLSQCASLEFVECNDNISEVTINNNIVNLSSLSLLDLTRTSNWSAGILNSDYTLLLDSSTDQMTVTYTYSVNAPNIPGDGITFTLSISPQLPEVQADIQTEPAPSTITVPSATAPAIVTYVAAFNSNGGNEITAQSVQAGNKAVAPSNPVKSGFIFEGWYLGDALFDFNTIISDNITLTAHWKQVSPAKPTIKRIKNYKKSKMKITVKAVQNIDGYEISYSTYKNAKKKAIVINTAKTTKTVKNLVKGKTYYVRVRTYALDSTGEKIYSKYSKIKKVKIKKGLAEVKATSTSATIKSCKITSENNVRISAKTRAIVKSKDNYYYLFQLPSYKKRISKKATPLDAVLKATSFKFNTALNLDTSKSLLQSKFVVAVKVKSGYKIISKAKYITNPQKIADFSYSFPTAATKKGLQINATMLNDVKDLGVKNSAFNIPLDMIIAAPGENNYHSGIDYEYNGKTYWFRKGMIAAYDSLFRQLKNQDIVVTAIVLLGWRDDLTYLITPSGREEGHYYYNFNTSNSKARKQLEATFSFLAERYASDDGNGRVVNWIIGNEINSFDSWNYAGTKSLSKYTQLYADSYRLAYTAIKSVYSNARLYVSLDQCWNISNSATFSGKEFLGKFDSMLKENGDISWNLAYHAYPSPLTDPRFWNNANGLSQNNENTRVVSIYNINVLTKYMKKHYGKSTRIILSEQGFTSASPYGEKVQAAAMAYSYYLAEFNPMIDAFILSRHVDNVAETRCGLNLGLWTNKPGHIEEAYHKKYAWKVYKYMDTPSSTKVTKFALKIIGTSSWKKIVPKYKTKKFKSMSSAN